MSERKYSTVYLPVLGSPCDSAHGCRVESPNGDHIPGVLRVNIDARPEQLVEVTVTMLARVVQLEDSE